MHGGSSGKHGGNGGRHGGNEGRHGGNRGGNVRYTHGSLGTAAGVT